MHSRNNYALGQAKAILFFIILTAVSIIQVRISIRRRLKCNGYEENSKGSAYSCCDCYRSVHIISFLSGTYYTFKNANGIVANPVSFAGASFAQFKTNISNVVNNSNFSFWSAFGTSAIITVVSLVLLALFGGMAAWVICRNKT